MKNIPKTPKIIPKLSIRFHSKDEFGNQKYTLRLLWWGIKDGTLLDFDDDITVEKPSLNWIKDFWDYQLIHNNEGGEKQIIEEKVQNLSRLISKVKENLWISLSKKMKAAFDEFYSYKKKVGEIELILEVDDQSNDEEIEIPWEFMKASSFTNNCLSEEYILGKILRSCKNDKVRFKKIGETEKINVLIITKLSEQPWLYIKKEPTLHKILHEVEQGVDSYINYLNIEKDNILEIAHEYGIHLEFSDIIKLITNQYKDKIFDLILIVGSCNSSIKSDIPIGSVILRKNEYIGRDHWKTQKGNPVFFLDGCYSARMPLENPIEGRCFGGSNKALKTLLGDESKNVVFIGSLFPIDPIYALSFAKNFVKYIFDYDRSLIEAMWEATNTTKKEESLLIEKYDISKKYKELYDLELNLFNKAYIATGKNVDLLCTSPIFTDVPQPKIFWTDVSFEYFDEISRGLFKAIGIRDIDIPIVPLEISKIEDGLKNLKDLVIAEFPVIAYKKRLYAQEQKENEFVIIGSVFTPKKDDCALVITGNGLTDLKGGDLFHTGSEKSVTTFLRILLNSEGINEKEIRFLLSPTYEDIEDNFIYHHIINKSEKKPVGWLQITGRMFAAEEIIDKFRKELPIPISVINIRKSAINKIIEKYQYVFDTPKKFNLPGTLLVCRREYVNKYAGRIYEILDSLRNNFLEKLSGEKFEYRNYNKAYGLDLSLKDRKVENYHDLNESIFLSQNEVRSLIYFTRYIREINLIDIENRSKKLVENELEIDDFLPIFMYPKIWKNYTTKCVKSVMHRSLIDYLNHIDNEIDSLTLSCEDNVINIDPLKKIKEKIMRRCDEIGQANSKYELNAIKFKIDYEVGDLIIEFEKILVRTKEEKRKKIFEKLKNLQNVIRSKNLDWRFNEKLLSFKSVPEIIYDENNKLKEELSDENLEINKKKIENIISIDYDINEIKNHVNMIMKHTLKYFEYYAAHGFNHVERVLDIMGRFIPDIFKTKFNPFELYILVVSSYTHDIGLAIDPAEWNGINKKHYGKKLPIESKNWDDILEKEKDIIRKLMRRYHAEIGAGYVLENWGDLKIKDFHTANYISKIIEAHSSKFNINELDKWNSIDFEKKTERFRTKFLASILRIVDALDIAFGRAKLEEFDWKRIKLKAPDQVVHWAYKMLIGSVTFKREGIGNWEIQINHLAKNGDELRNLMMFEGCSLKRELNSVKDILENEGVDSENKEKSIYLLYEKISFVDERTGETIELTDDKFDELLKERNTDEGKMKLNECANEIADRILKK